MRACSRTLSESLWLVQCAAAAAGCSSSSSRSIVAIFAQQQQKSWRKACLLYGSCQLKTACSHDRANYTVTSTSSSGDTCNVNGLASDSYCAGRSISSRNASSMSGNSSTSGSSNPMLWSGQLSTLPCAVHLGCNSWPLHQRSSAGLRSAAEASPHTHAGEVPFLLLLASLSTPVCIL